MKDNTDILVLIFIIFAICIAFLGLILPESEIISNSVSDLVDVNFIALQNGEILIYNSTSGNWTNGIIVAPMNISNLGDVMIFNLGSDQILRFNVSLGKWQNVPNYISLSSSVPSKSYSGMFWVNTTDKRLSVRSGDNSSWLNLMIYNSLLWDGHVFGDWLNQAVKTSSSPSFYRPTVTEDLVINGIARFGTYGDSWAIVKFGVGLIIQPILIGQGNIYIRDHNANVYITLNPYTGAGTFVSIVQAGGFKSSDGTSGVTQDVVVLTALPNTFVTLHFKNGLYVGYT